MKRITSVKIRLFAAAFAALGSLATAQAGSFFSDFESGLPANTAVYGVATVAGSGGVGGSGSLQLTTTAASQTGVFIITSDLDSGTPVVGFTASFKMTVGGGAGDGFSFNFANNLDLTGAWTTPAPEEGSGTGLTIEFDTYPNGGSDTAPSIDVKVGGTEVATSLSPQLITTTGNYVDVFIQLNPDLTLTVVYDGIYAYKNLDLSASLVPAVYPFTGALFGIGARNGSVTGNKWIDNLSIVTKTNTAAFVRSFAPTGRWTQPASTIDITITNDNTTVSSSGVALQLDGATVTPTVTTANGQTLIHYAPASAFGPFTSHSVSLVFADNASPTPNTNTLQYTFSIPATSYVTVFSDGFETYNLGALDKNLSGGPNEAPDGSGNPWWGPCPANLNVVNSGENGVTAHGGSHMIRGNIATADIDQIYYNLAYRLNAGSAYTGNVMLDWWFYDNLGSGGSANEDFVALAYYSLTATTTDWTPGVGNTVCNPSLNVSGSTIQRLSLGCSSSEGAGFDNTKYQARVVAPSDSYAGGWFNTTTPRTVGWHHGRIIVGPSVGPDLLSSYNYVQYFIDDMTNPTFWHIDTLSVGYNNIEINASYGSSRGYYDDVTFAVARPPNIAVSLSGTTATLTWPGIDFVLQSASSLTSPITWTDVTGATSPHPYDTTSNPQQLFRLRNH
jgi:hypothetical protein